MSEIWEYASRNDCVVISKDEDFLYLANTPSAKARLVWIRMGNCRTRVLLVRIPPKVNADSEGNANGIPGRRRTEFGA